MRKLSCVVGQRHASILEVDNLPTSKRLYHASAVMITSAVYKAGLVSMGSLDSPLAAGIVVEVVSNDCVVQSEKEKTRNESRDLRVVKR